MEQESKNKSGFDSRDEVVISIVVPTYNEEEVLGEFHRRLSAMLATLPERVQILYVNDGSTDGTRILLRNFGEKDPRVAILDLSRNFGKEIAMTAGLDHASGEAVIIIDADLQDPPELIPELIKHWRDGYDIVYAKRIARDGESAVKKLTASFFYWIMQNIGRVTIPADTGDFRLLSRCAVAALKQLREQHRFMKGLFVWIGYPQKAVHYRREPRYAGKTKWNYLRLWNLALEGITSFTIMPLKISTYIGFVTALGSLAYGIIIIFRTLFFGNPVPGYPSLMVVILLLGGVQLITMGIMGEYLGRIFNETKNRPLYFLKDYDTPEIFQPETAVKKYEAYESADAGAINER
ncbi:glycosyltransferase family 2 protein [bacterium]|nr:glycosyltransferase family 2 protein [bacterium]